MKAMRNVISYLRQPVQGKSGVKNINRPSREKPPVERAGHASGKVRAVLVSGQALLHAATTTATTCTTTMVVVVAVGW